MATFGSAGSINYPDKKALSEGHSMRSTCGSTRHSSLGDHKSLEAEALAEVRASGKAVGQWRPRRGTAGWGLVDWGGTLPFMPCLKAKSGHKIGGGLPVCLLPPRGSGSWVGAAAG